MATKQTAIRARVYRQPMNDNEGIEPIGTVVMLVTHDDERSGFIVEFRKIGVCALGFPDLQGATIELDIADGNSPAVAKDGKTIAFLNGEAARYDQDATKHYVEMCQVHNAHPPEQ